MRVLVQDRTTYSLSNRKITDEGFLSAPAHVARAGIQQYLAFELGLGDRNPMDVINVYRPPEEVFKDESLSTYAFKEVTDNHPPEMVSAVNYRDHSVGQVVSKGVQSGDYVQIDLMVKDAAAIKRVQDGKTELSAGYFADYVPERGVVDGQEYEFTQRNIVINHVALVDKARAGAGAKIFDKQGEPTMSKQTVVLDNGRKVEVEDSAAQLIEDSIQRLTKLVADAKAAKDAAEEEAEKEKARADLAEDELEKEKEKTTDAAIAKIVNDTLRVHESARRLVKGFDCTGKSLDAIKLEVATSLYPKRKFDDAKPAYINAVFDAAVDAVEDEDEDEDENKSKTTDSHRRLAEDLQSVEDAFTVRDQARKEFLDKRYNASKLKVGA